MKRRVVVTGMGVVSPLGHEIDEFWNNLKQGVSGVGPVTRFDASELGTQIAAEVKDLVIEDFIPKREAKKMDRYAQYGVVAALKALQDSKIEMDQVDANRFGVVLGSGNGGIETFEEEARKVVDKGPTRISPFFIPMMIVNMGAGQISIATGAKGPNYTTVTACASATNAIGDAFRIISRGDAELMFAGGAEAPLTLMSLAGFSKMKATSTRNDDPTKASRPFDKNRDGFVMGEGAGVLILEELEHAKARGAKIYGEVVGYGMSADAYHITSPAPGGEGAARSMKASLEDAGVSPQEVNYINAHGTSTPYNDLNETLAIKSVFGDHAYELSINSTKSMTGHLLGAAGAVEAMATLLQLQEGFIHPTINYEEADPELDLDYTPNHGKERAVTYGLSNSLGFGGHNATLLFKKYL